MAQRLRDSTERRKRGMFLIDGEREIERALQYGFEIETIFVAEGEEAGLVLEGGPSAISLQPVKRQLLGRIAYGQREEGMVAVARTPDLRLAALRSPPGNLLILDRTEKPGNLGACLRTCAAGGIAAVILTNPVCEVFNPNTIRASRGSVFALPIGVCSPVEAQAYCRKHGISMRTARVDGSRSLWACPMTAPVALVFGSEAYGLGEDWLVTDIESFHIPMQAGADSLNLSISVAISLYELVRQQWVGSNK